MSSKYQQSIEEDRKAWRREVERDGCMWCGGTGDWRGLQIHEITRRSHAQSRWWARCNALIVCGHCHETILNTKDAAHQLACKLKNDCSNFNLISWLKIADPELRAPQRVTVSDVLVSWNDLYQTYPNSHELQILSVPLFSTIKTDRTGFSCNRWEIVGFAGKNHRGRATWICKCQCGTVRISDARKIVANKSISCGCYAREASSKAHRKHGMCNSRTYRKWTNMKRRCSDLKNASYSSYGHRGITFADEWNSFDVFYSDMGDAPPGMTLERIDTNGNYCKSNCRWASPKDQARNKRNNHLVQAFGQTKTQAEWCEEYQINWCTVRDRLARGVSAEDALSVPVAYKKRTART